MFYRPTAPDGAPYLRLQLKPGASTKRLASQLAGLIGGGGGGAGGGGGEGGRGGGGAGGGEGALVAVLAGQLGMRFVDTAVHESEVGGCGALRRATMCGCGGVCGRDTTAMLWTRRCTSLRWVLGWRYGCHRGCGCGLGCGVRARPVSLAPGEVR